MKISTKGRYALRMMLDIAVHQGEGYVALKDTAQREEISKKYLEQIALQLTQAGLLRAVRGHQGGYRLLKAPHFLATCLALRPRRVRSSLIKSPSLLINKASNRRYVNSIAFFR